MHFPYLNLYEEDTFITPRHPRQLSSYQLFIPECDAEYSVSHSRFPSRAIADVNYHNAGLVVFSANFYAKFIHGTLPDTVTFFNIT